MKANEAANRNPATQKLRTLKKTRPSQDPVSHPLQKTGSPYMFHPTRTAMMAIIMLDKNSKNDFRGLMVEMDPLSSLAAKRMPAPDTAGNMQTSNAEKNLMTQIRALHCSPNIHLKIISCK